MCGICGIYDPRGGIDLGLVQRMNEAIHHRGPDAEAVKSFDRCVLAYKRLSIIDLPTGFQPMSEETGSSWIVYNGEIYNYKALREALLSRGHALKTNSDTETIIHLYEEKGPEALHELNGMFAFAIWDEGLQRLMLARDRLGVKPLYYYEHDGRVAFASEIKGILADSAIPRRLNYAAFADYLTFQNVFGDKTFFEGIHLLPPGHLLLAQGGKVEIRKYWDLHFREEIVDEYDAVRKFGALIDESVEMQLVSDVPIGSHLSGGMDSGTVVMLASKKLAERLKTFSVYFREPEFDESGLIEQVSLHADTIHHDLLLDPSEFPNEIPRIFRYLDEPRGGPSVIPQWYISRLASKHVKVVLTGHGGDELYAGYPSYVVAYLRDVVRRRDWREIRSILRNLWSKLATEGWKRIIGLPLYALVNRDLIAYGREPTFKPHEQRRLLTESARNAIAGYNPRPLLDKVLEESATDSPIDRLLYLDIKTYLPSLLLVEDRMSMAHSIEDRVPILDHRIAELAAATSGRIKIRDLTLKRILRRHANGLLPRAILEHRKVGFLVPLAEWLRRPLRVFLEEMLLSERAASRDLLRPEAVRKYVEAHLSGSRDYSWKLWSLLNIELWCRTWIDNPNAGPEGS